MIFLRGIAHPCAQHTDTQAYAVVVFLCVCVYLYVRVSVTRQYCIKMAKFRITQIKT